MKHRNLTISLIFLTTVTGLCAMRAVSRSSTTTQDGTDYKALTEQIEIMRRVWTRSVSDRFAELYKEDAKNSKDGSPGDGDSDVGVDATGGSAGNESARTPSGATASKSGNLLSTFWQTDVTAANIASGEYQVGFSATSDTRGLYLPGHGVVYSTDIQVPLKAAPTEEAEGENANPDAWEQARHDVRGTSDPTIYTLANAFARQTSGVASSGYVMDKRYIDAAVDSILGSIGRYGSRIEQLPGSESIAVAIRLVPRGQAVFYYAGARSYAHSPIGDDGEVGRFVIEVPHSVLGKDLSAAQLKSQCKITRY